MNITRDKIKKLYNLAGDKVFKVFELLILFFFYSLVLPIALGLVIALGELASIIDFRLRNTYPPYVYFIAAVVFGIFFKLWREDYLERKKREKDNETNTQNEPSQQAVQNVQIIFRPKMPKTEQKN